MSWKAVRTNSLALRLSALFTLVALLVFLLIGWALYKQVDRSLDLLPSAELEARYSVLESSLMRFGNQEHWGKMVRKLDQLKERKRLAQVVVGAFAQAVDAVFDALAGGEHDYRGLLACAQRPQYAIAIEAGEHDVEDDHRVVAFQRQVQTFDAVPRQVDGKALLGEAAVQVVGGFFFIFDNQNAHGWFLCTAQLPWLYGFGTARRSFAGKPAPTVFVLRFCDFQPGVGGTDAPVSDR